jgi:hypothetical protein
MSTEDFERFRSQVLADPGLQRRLRDLDEWEEFARVAIGVSAGLGLAVDEHDIDEAHRAARRAWLERWI